MSQRIDNFIIREADGLRFANSLVLGRGIPLSTTAGGLPELEGVVVGETQLLPSGGDDTQAIRDALASAGRVRLGPGEFSVSGQIDLGNGQSVVGSGPDRTHVRTGSFASYPAFHLTGSGAAVENLRISGDVTNACVTGDSATDVRLRTLRITNGAYGIRLDNVTRCEISRAHVQTRLGGISVTWGAQVVISGVAVQGADEGVVLTQVDGAYCAGISVRDCLVAVLATGKDLAFSSVLTDLCDVGIHILSASGVAVSGLNARDCSQSALGVVNSNAVALSGCSVLRAQTALRIIGSTAVTVDGLVSDNTGSGSTAPHVVVGSGSTLVTVTSVHVVSPAIPPQFEVDVSGAGSRVVFIQHDFDPARINSGGNFVAL